MRQFGRRVDGLSGRRRRVRQPVILAASAMSIDRSRSVLVADLSPSGAMLHGRDLPREGSEVLVAVGSQDSFATIVWRNDDACGIEFEMPLPEHRLAQLQHEGCWASVTGVTA
jgi:hypothetical protein